MAVGVASMRAGVVAAPGAATLEDAPLREPGAGEVLVRVEGCGVCGSNVPVWEGRPWFEYPLPPGAPGHEAWGVVEETGDRVAVLGDGGFAEYLVARSDEVVRIPDELAGEPVPGEPLACVMNVFRRSKIRPGERVAVLGVGFLGALLVQLAAGAGADVVDVWDGERDRTSCGPGRDRVRADRLDLVARDCERVFVSR